MKNITNLKSGLTNINKEQSCCFSGHRIVSNTDKNIIKANLPKILKSLVENNIKTFIAGGAIGFDTIAAKAVLKLKETNSDVKLIMALPCVNQDERWNRNQKTEYREILDLADEVIYVSNNYTSDCMLKRNRFMVDNSSTIIIYLQYVSGGTAYTVNYALDEELEVINVITPE